MARWFAAARRRLLLGGWLAVLALVPACSDGPAPGGTASVEQAAPDVAGALAAGDSRSRQEHLERLGAPRWHERGWRGQGVRVAILDSGFRGYRSYLGKGLPAAVRTRSFRADGDLEARDSQHGILCAEVAHAIAPQAELLFATWEPDSPRAFLDAVAWARAEGARVLSCSLIMPGWSDGEGGGATHQALARLLGTGRDSRDLLCFASAGNTAERHWSGSYCPDRAGRHQWSPGQTDNVLTPWGTERVAVELYGPTHSAYDLQVIDTTAGTIIGTARLAAREASRGRAIVRFEPAAGAAYALRLRGALSATGERFHIVVLGGNLGCATSHGSIAFPGDGAHVYAVGAVDGAGSRIHYSSCGPNSPLPKPDFVASVPFPSQCRERPFAGTSAAAPQAAGLAAVLLSRTPQAAPAQIIAALRGAALDLGPQGHDWETGYGLLRLPCE
jgi:subtilisin family serine protease